MAGPVSGGGCGRKGPRAVQVLCTRGFLLLRPPPPGSLCVRGACCSGHMQAYDCLPCCSPTAIRANQCAMPAATAAPPQKRGLGGAHRQRSHRGAAGGLAATPFVPLLPAHSRSRPATVLQSMEIDLGQLVKGDEVKCSNAS